MFQKSKIPFEATEDGCVFGEADIAQCSVALDTSSVQSWLLGNYKMKRNETGVFCIAWEEKPLESCATRSCLLNT